MKKTNKKGFTIVELVIVIAVIGILAAVLIPTFAGIIDSANRAVDTQLVAQINTILAIEDVLGGGVNDAVEIQKVIKENGLKLETKVKGQYIWYDIENKTVVLGGLNENGFVPNGASSRSATKGLFNQDTIAPENFIDGYLFLSTESADGLAENIYALRNPEGSTPAEVSASLTATLGKIKNTALKNNLSAMLSTTAVMTKDGVTGFIGSNNNSVTRVIVSSEMTNITPDTINTVVGYTNVIAVDFHSGVVTADDNAIATLKARTEKPYFVYSGDELKKIDKDNDDIAFLIHKDERGEYIKKVYVQKVIDGEITGASDGELVTEFLEYQFTYNLAYEYLKGTDTKSYDFVAYSFHKDGSNPLELGEHTHMLSSAEKLLIDSQGNLTIYLVYETAPTDFKVGSEYYSSKTTTRKLAMGEITSGTITVVSTTATLGDDTYSEITIPNGVTLHLPYYTGTGDSKVYSSDTSAKDADDINNTTSGANKFNAEFDKLTTPGHTNLTIVSGVVLTNYGTIYVDGQLYGSSGITTQCYTNEVCGVLTIENGAKVIVDKDINNKEGTLYAYGIVRGDGEINANEGTIVEVFTILDWGGGTSANNAVSHNVSPFNNWRADNIRVKTIMKTGAEYAAFGSVNIDDEDNKVDFALVGPQGTNTTPLFLMQPGATIQKSYENGDFHLTVLEGKIIDSEKEMSFTIKGMTKAINFKKIPLPMPAFDITVAEGAEIELNNNLYKILPGSDIVVNGKMTINTTVAAYDNYDLKLIEMYKVGSKFELVGKDELTECVYTDKTLTIKYNHYERKYVVVGSYELKSSNVKASCAVQIYPTDRVASPLTINGELVFGEQAVFTGDIVSNTEFATIEVKTGAKFTNSQQVTDVNGNKITIHGFNEGLGFMTSTGASIDIGSLTYGHWQQSYAVGVDLTGNFRVDLDFGTIPEGAAIYTYNGSIWE